ncbi:unnamed protein product [Cylicostephanus goldi]|uniref:BAR domain-containing protein n=1 Tax=Cylicostephanus goldi TaxID=71465 RepID=A0A3P7MIG4_CYLGO|nr:unnamed protein product [Cylicostephanus goldi]
MNKLYLKAAERIGIVEETKLEPTFEEGIKKVEAYRLAVDSALDGLEAMMQPNRLVVETGAIVAPPGQDPHEVMAAACTKLRQYVDSASQVPMTSSIVSRDGRAAIRRIRRFVTVDNQQMKDDMEKVKEGLELMDVARHEASKIQLVIDELPVTIFTNQREVVKFFIQREKYHSTATGILKDLVEKIEK